MATIKQVSEHNTSRLFCGKVWIVITFFVLFSSCFGSDAKIEDCSKLFPSCTCTNTSVTCVNESRLTNITQLYPYVGDDVETVTIDGSNFREIPTNLLRSCRGASDHRLMSLTYLALPNNRIETIHGKSFHCMPKLQKLILKNNRWKNDLHANQKRYFTSLPELNTLDLTNAFDDVWNGTIHFVKLAAIFNGTDMTKLEILRLSHNEFYSFSKAAANTFCALSSLKFLDLSYNKLLTPSLSAKPDCLTNLEILNFSDNQIEILPEEFMTKLDSLPHLQKVFLGNNAYRCDGDLKPTWKWLNSTKVPIADMDDIHCGKESYDPSYTGRKVLSLSLSDLKYRVPAQASSTATKVVVGIIFAVIGCTIIGFIIFHRKQLGLVMKRWKKRLPRLNLRPYYGYSSVQEVSTVEKI